MSLTEVEFCVFCLIYCSFSKAAFLAFLQHSWVAWTVGSSRLMFLLLCPPSDYDSCWFNKPCIILLLGVKIELCLLSRAGDFTGSKRFWSFKEWKTKTWLQAEVFPPCMVSTYPVWPVLQLVRPSMLQENVSLRQWGDSYRLPWSSFRCICRNVIMFYWRCCKDHNDPSLPHQTS